MIIFVMVTIEDTAKVVVAVVIITNNMGPSEATRTTLNP